METNTKPQNPAKELDLIDKKRDERKANRESRMKKLDQTIDGNDLINTKAMFLFLAALFQFEKLNQIEDEKKRGLVDEIRELIVNNSEKVDSILEDEDVKAKMKEAFGSSASEASYLAKKAVKQGHAEFSIEEILSSSKEAIKHEKIQVNKTKIIKQVR